MDGLEALGLPTAGSLKRHLALDIHLQIAGLEDIASGVRVEIPRVAQQLIQDRDSTVLDRLTDVIDLRELSLMEDGGSIPMSAVEERAPHVAVVFAFETAKAVASIWPAFVNARDKSVTDGSTE